MTVIASEAAGAEIPREYPRRAAVISWIFFDWAAQPYFTLITTFVFAPYFASFVAPDPAQGQALWGFATAAAGLMIALLSPVLGAIADASGRRKPWIAGFGSLLVIGACLMWFGKPGDPSVILPLLLAYAIASVGVEFATVFNNAMMPTLVPPDRIGRLSGTGWATGYIGGILSLILVLGFLAANPDTGRTLFGLAPLFGLDPVSHQGDRITGPLDGHLVHHLRVADVSADAGLPGKAPDPRGDARRIERAEADARRIAEAEIAGDIPARQHDLYRRAGVAVCVRGHLRRRHFRLAYDPDRKFWNSAGHRRHFRRVARRQARRQARTQARHRRQLADPAVRARCDSCWSTRIRFCSSRSRRRRRAARCSPAPPSAPISCSDA